jgi:hypothetical protein
MEDSLPGCLGRQASNLSIHLLCLQSTGKMPIGRDRQDAYPPLHIAVLAIQ